MWAGIVIGLCASGKQKLAHEVCRMRFAYGAFEYSYRIGAPNPSR